MMNQGLGTGNLQNREFLKQGISVNQGANNRTCEVRLEVIVLCMNVAGKNHILAHLYIPAVSSNTLSLTHPSSSFQTNCPNCILPDVFRSTSVTLFQKHITMELRNLWPLKWKERKSCPYNVSHSDKFMFILTLIQNSLQN